MEQIRIKRILYELKQINKKQGEHGIYYHINDDNINEIYVMIIGPEDTPYYLGFYCFKATYPDNYPFSPIKVRFLTTESNVRMNPNLYGNGKVCLSILGTWTGPSWTSIMNIFSVFTSIVGEIFVKDPFKNEPGQEQSSNKTNECYNNYLYHENLRLAIVNTYSKPTYSKYFIEIISKYIIDNKEKYLELLKFYESEEIKNKDIIIFKTPNLWSKYNHHNIYPYLIKKFKKILDNTSVSIDDKIIKINNDDSLE
jgi:ubiquitin-protein ligase